MRGISVFRYSIAQGFRSLKKNRMFSFASIGTIAACLFLFGLFYFVVANFQNMIHSVQSSVGVTVFFDAGISQEQIQSIGEVIQARPEVERIAFISAEEAWQKFKNDMAENSQEDLASTFGDDNPLADSASYEVYLKDAGNQGRLVTYLETIDGVRQVKRSDATARSLSNANALVGYVSGAIILILLLVSMFLIRTTISAGITVRKTEIGIMQVLGASDFFVRAPFVVEGIIIGLIGTAIPLLILFLAYGRILGYIQSHFTALSGMLTFLSTKQIFMVLLPVSCVIGIGIGFLGSYFTVRKHLHA